MAKKKTKVTKQTINNENEMAKFIKLIVIITVLFLIFYGITIFITRDKTKDKGTNNGTSATIDFDQILIGNLFDQPDDSYYVMVEDMDDVFVQPYRVYLSNYNSMDKAIHVYYSVLNHPLNAPFVGETNKTDIKNIKELKIAATTLLKIEKGKIVESITGKDELLKYFEKLTKAEDKGNK